MSADTANPKTAEQLTAEYAARHASYIELTNRTEALIVDLLNSRGIQVIQVESRTKSVDSFAEKVRRKGRTMIDSLDAVTDLSGIRVITYYLEDVVRVSEMIHAEFEVDDVNSGDKVDSLAADQFGYRSDHLVCRLNDGRRTLAEWSRYQDLCVEIQVRTALQHAWAAVSHKVEYKRPEDSPERVRRQLYRLSALFELADEQFSALRDAGEEVQGAYEQKVRGGSLGVPLDSSSLQTYASLTNSLDSLAAALTSAGIPLADLEAVEHKDVNRDIADLVTFLRKVGFDTLQDLHDFVSKVDEVVQTGLVVWQACASENPEGLGTVFDALTQIAMVSLDDGDSLGRPTYTEEYSAALREARARIKGT